MPQAEKLNVKVPLWILSVMILYYGFWSSWYLMSPDFGDYWNKNKIIVNRYSSKEGDMYNNCSKGVKLSFFNVSIRKF